MNASIYKMASQFRYMLLNNWNIARWLRLILGGAAGIQAIGAGDGLLGFVAAVLVLQAITNTGCCGNACAVNIGTDKVVNPNEISTKPIEYTTVNENDHGNSNR